MSALTAPTFYYSTDTGAPVINNTIGNAIPWFDAILVTGYPLSTATQLTFASGEVTVNKTAHGMSVGDITTISGADQDEYNGRVQVASVIDADNFKYVPLATPGVSPATGTISFSNSGGKPGLGWQKVFSGTNKAAYRPRFGNRYYLRVEHSALAYNLNARGFETMSDVDNGTGPFPTVAQIGGSGLFWQWTNNALSTRPFVAVGDATVLYAIIDVRSENGYANGFMFGDFPSFKPGDLYNTLIIGKVSSVANSTLSNLEKFNFATATTGHYVPRAVNQAGSAFQVGKTVDGSRLVSDTSGEGRMSGRSTATTYPQAVDGGLHLCRFLITEAATGNIRGYLRGIWAVCHDTLAMAAAGVAGGDTFTGSDGLVGRSFRWTRIGNGNNGQNGSIALETGDTWDD